MSKKCINCGAELEDDQLFCDDCGTKQISEPQPKEKKSKKASMQEVMSEADKQAMLQAEAEAKVRLEAERAEKIKRQEERKIRLEAERAEKVKKQEVRKNNPKHLAIASLILGIISYLSILTVIVPIITCILGIVFGFKGTKSEKKKIAIAGIVLNISFIAFLVAVLILA